MATRYGASRTEFEALKADRLQDPVLVAMRVAKTKRKVSLAHILQQVHKELEQLRKQRPVEHARALARRR
jgi:hypothetical protein